MRIAYLGNHQPGHPAPFSTESHVARSLELEGHDVVRIQEGETRAVDVPDAAAGSDLFLWTQTYGLAVSGGTIDERAGMLDRLREKSIPTVGFHLDRWWDLDREDQVRLPEPFFRCDRVYTADGGHDDRWAALGINHRWSPPAVADFECEPADPDRRFAAAVAFVGSWRGGYHAEWAHRPALIDFLRRTYGPRLRLWPAHPRQPVRGDLLRAVYASTTVLVGDSCLVPRRDDGTPCVRYCSDRIPETTGRGGYLVHPRVEGVTDGLWVDGEHLDCWTLGDFDDLRSVIDRALDDPDRRARISTAGRAHTLEHHTYRVRMRTLLADLAADGLLAGAAT